MLSLYVSPPAEDISTPGHVTESWQRTSRKVCSTPLPHPKSNSSHSALQMVCRLLQVSVPVSSSPLQSPASSASSSGRQLRSELAQAVERTMVFTRSHDHTPATIGQENAKVDGIGFMTSAKRKSEYDADATTPTQHAAQRRMAVEKLKSDITSTPQIATAVVIEVGKQDGHGMRQQEQSESEPDTRPQKITETAAPSSTMPPRPNSRGSDTHTEIPLTEPVPVDLEQEDDREETSNGNNAEPGQRLGSSPAKDVKESNKVDNTITEDGTNEEPSPETTQEIETTVPTPNPPKSTHKRFDSVEPEPFQPQPRETKQDEKAPNDNLPDSSDDEAPETVTASTGQAHALNAALEQSKAAAQLKKERKLKRQERDARLKEQAKTAKKANKADITPKRSKPKAAAEETINTPTPNPIPQIPKKPKQPLPALLPDHILAEEPPIRPLIPLPLPTSKAMPNLKKRFLDLEQKPPKDIKKGGVRIRVLQEGNGRLPPKASQQGRAVREAWLMGRGTVERRKTRGQGGFVRR